MKQAALANIALNVIRCSPKRVGLVGVQLCESCLPIVAMVMILLAGMLLMKFCDI